MTESQPDPYSAEHIRELLRRASVASRRRREAVATTLRITETDWRALLHISRGAPTTPGDLQRHLELTSGGTTALINRLEDRGYVTRVRTPRDKRSSHIKPTATALTAVERFHAPIVTALEQCARELSDDQRAVLGAFLQRVITLSSAAADANVRGSAERHHPHVRPAAPEEWA